MHPNRLIRFLGFLLVSLATVSAVYSASFGDPRGFLTNETVVEKALYPGVLWYEIRGLDGGRPQVVHVVKVDISEPHLSLKALAGERFVSGSQYFRRSTVSQLQADNDAFVSINTAFFDIGATMAPSGLLLRDKMLLREPVGSGNVLLFDDAGVPRVGRVSSSNQIVYNGIARGFQGMNANNLGGNGINVYQQPWDRSPGAGFISAPVTEVLLERTAFVHPSQNAPARLTGRVLQVRNNQPSVTIGANQFVITAAGTSRSFLQGMTVNSTVDVQWRLTNTPPDLSWNRITQGVAGGSLLVINGQVQSESRAHWTARHPRSSIGINLERTELVLVLVEGRQENRAEGMSLHRLAAWHHHMGAHEALEFDGGGSSAMVARVDGGNTRLNTPSDGSERYVPAGLGVMLVEEMPSGFFRNIRVSSGEGEAVLSWETPLPAISHAKYGFVSLDQVSANDAQPRRRHTALLTGLGTEQYYARLVADRNGQIYQSQLIEIPGGGEVSVIVDDKQAQFSGTWTLGEFGVPWEGSYRWTSSVQGSPTHSATFRPNLPVSGRYDLFTWYVSGTNRPTDARYQILHRDGTRSVTINQQTNGSTWRPLAENLSFSRGTSHSVVITNQSQVAGRAIMADAVRWVLRDPDVEEGEVPGWWLEHFFGEDIPELSSDPDGDGVTVAEEYLWGTDPVDPESRFRIELEYDQAEWRLTFSPFQEGRMYRLRESSDLSASWNVLSQVTPVRLETGEGQFRLPVPSDAVRRFYQVEISR